MQGSDLPAFDLRVKNVNESSYDLWSRYFDTQYPEWVKALDIDSSDAYTFGRIRAKIILGERYNLDRAERWVDYITFESNFWLERYHELLSQLPTFPNLDYNENESLLILPSSLIYASKDVGTVHYSSSDFITMVNNTHQFQIIVDYTSKFTTNLTIPFKHINYTTTKFWQLTPLDYA